MTAEGPSVLVVDDNPGDARLVEWTLTHEDGRRIRVARADRIATALDRLADGAFDAVLLDLGLPDSRGTDGLARIRAAAPGVAVIVLSGAEDPERVRAALEAGAQDYRVKGIFGPGELVRVLDAAIDRQRRGVPGTASSPESRPVPAPADGGPPIDPEAFGQLVELGGGDATFVPSVLRSFLEEADRLVPAIGDAARRGDRQGVADAAHRLKSDAAQVGALSLARLLKELERSAPRDDRAEIERRAVRIAQAYGPVAEALRERARGSVS